MALRLRVAGSAAFIALAAATYGVFVWTEAGRDVDAWGLAARLRQQEIGQLMADQLVIYLGMLALLLAVVVALACATRLRDGAAMLAMVGVPVLVTQVAKDVLGRPDPVPAEVAASWPSGHVAVASVAAVVMLAAAGDRGSWPRRNAVLLVGGMTTLTLLLGWHRISDAIGALCITGAVAMLAVFPRPVRLGGLASVALAVLAAGAVATMVVLIGAAAVLFTNDGAWHLPHAPQVLVLVPVSFAMAFLLARLTLLLAGRSQREPRTSASPLAKAS